MTTRYIIRLDDIAENMHWDNYQRLSAIFDRLGIKPLLGVVPDLKDPELLAFPKVPMNIWDELRARQAQGWGIALHGYTHVYDSTQPGIFGDVPRSEFAGIPYNEQRRRIETGKAILEAHGLRIEAFMAPSHSFDGNTLRVLREVGIPSVTDGYGFYPYREQGLLFVPQMNERPIPMPFGVLTFCIHLNGASPHFLARVEKFMERHARNFIPYSEAAQYESNTALGMLSGRILHKIAHFKRRSRLVLSAPPSTIRCSTAS